MAWFFAPLIFFLFAGVLRFNCKEAGLTVDFVVGESFPCHGDFLTRNWMLLLSQHRRDVNSGSGYYLYYLLLLSGDVALNPGQVRFPCVVCHFPVRSNQRALLCDDCGFWCHCKCCSVSKAQYHCFQLQKHFSWTCPSCLSKALPFHDCSVLSSSDMEHYQGDVLDSMSIHNLPSPPTAHSFLKVAHLNCRSLLANSDDVFLFMRSNCIDIMTLSETWLDESISDLEICPESNDMTY